MSYDVPDMTERVTLPKNRPMMHGLRVSTVEAFVQFIKDNCSGQLQGMNVILDPLDCEELDALGKRFLSGDTIKG